jgi:PII-like signaling protein
MGRQKGKTEMLKQYDFSKGVRGKYAKRYATGTNIVVLSPDVVEIFPDSESVNEALRTLAKIIRQQARRKASG